MERLFQWRGLASFARRVDWLLVCALLLLLSAGLATMHSFTGEGYHLNRQLVWIALSLVVFFSATAVDWIFLRRSSVVATIFFISLIFLASLPFIGDMVGGSRRWLNFGPVSFQPSDLLKLALILLLAKYLSRRHIEIANIRHILISGVYAFIPFVLILIQPDLGTAVVIFLIWFGMVMFSGISKKHLALVISVVAISFCLAWVFVFADYQKARIMSFVYPLSDIRGAGYNSFQSIIAIGSGELFGKGLGFGTQSRLRFLPEYQTDFIFAAFAEEWGFVGVMFLFALFSIVIWRIIRVSQTLETNFESLFGVGLAILLMSHFVINVGMNIGLLPVTGLTLPFVSYGGSHLLTAFLGLGILMGMRKYSRGYHRDDLKNEFLGVG